ncbi:MAG: PaaI family thioesterase [Gemmatimonadota bacterium]|nr:PaaI family thioesterase [Gemmatimonadota bacterium]
MKDSPHVLFNHDRCFACGTENPRGLGVNFISENGVTTGHFTVHDGLESLGGITHGGILTTLMDAAMARWLFDRDIVALTATLNVRFRMAVSPGKRLIVEARRKSKRGKRHYMESKLINEEHQEVASSEAVFYQSSI